MKEKQQKSTVYEFLIPHDGSGMLLPASLITLPEDLPDGMSASELEKPDTLDQIKSCASEVVRINSVEDAKVLLEKIASFNELENTNTEAYEVYKHVTIAMNFISLSVKKTTDINDLLKSQMVKALKIGIRVTEQIDSFFIVNASDPNTYSRIEKQFIGMLESNSEIIGKEKITLKADPNKLTSTVQNWLKDYNQSTSKQNRGLVGVAQRGSVERATYLSQNFNAQKLNTDDRELLRKVLELYDWIKFAPKGVLSPENKRLISANIQPSNKKGVSQAARNKIATPIISAKRSPNLLLAKKRIIPRPPKPTLKAVIPPPAKSLPDIIKKPPVSKSPISQAPKPSLQKPSELKIDKKAIQSSLDELNKMREQFEKPKSDSGTPASRPRSSISVNEAVISQGRDRNIDSGEIVAGNKEIDDKLEELEKKLDRNL